MGLKLICKNSRCHFMVSAIFIVLLAISKNAYSQSFKNKDIALYDYFNRFFIQEIPIEVSGLIPIMDSTFGLEKIQLTIHHQRVSDLKIQLQSPDGNTVWVTNRNGGINGVDYVGTKFTQYGKDGLINNATAPFSGEFTPSGQLTYFTNGSNPNGTWKLLVEDLQSGVDGYLDSVSLTFGNQPAVIRQKQYCGFDKPELCECNRNNTCTLLPDLVVVPSFTKTQWQEFAWNDAMYPRQLKISVAIANIGIGPMEIAIDSLMRKQCCDRDITKPIPDKRFDIFQNIYTKTNKTFSKASKKAGTIYFESMPGHQHYHVDDWVAFRLLKIEKGKRIIISKGNKVSYCLFTTGMLYDQDSSSIIHGKAYGANMINYGLGNYYTCDLGKQGITVGGYDYYGMMYEGQYLILPPNLKSGKYILEVEIDPNHYYHESNKANNIFQMEILLNQQIEK